MELLGLGAGTAIFFVTFGLLIGMLFGCFGMGGSFLVTPALLVLGYPAQVAVGSGLAFVFGTSAVGALRHRTDGQVDHRLAALMILGMTLGIEAGKRVVFRLDGIGSADSAVGIAYVGMLALVGLFLLFDARRDGDWADGQGGRARLGEARLPPTVTLAGDGEVSVWIVLSVGAVVGFLSGFLGVGGGFLLFPAMVYGFGVPAAVAVGTDVLQITVSSAYGAFVYADAGAVSLPVVGTLLVGSAFGARIGAGSLRYIDEDDVKGYFALTLLAGSLSIAASELSDHLGNEALQAVSVALIFGAPVLVSAAIGLAAIRGLNREVAIDPNDV